jgi:hypothetical protein
MKRFVPHTTAGKILAVIAGIVIFLGIVAIVSGSGKASGSTASSSSSCQPVPPRTCDYPSQGAYTSQTATPAATKTKKHTVTFVVTGAPADVTYGHGGSSTHGTVPMRVTEPLIGSANTYDLTAVLGENGTVKIKIYVDGKLIAHAKATGQYQSAMAVIDKNPFTDQWESSLGS